MPGLRAGLRLNARFTLVRPLGAGGMGQVWVVADRDLDTQVAAKILPPETPADLVALLRRECLNARRLQHPNIVPVFDFHRPDDGHPGDGGRAFITMALVEGEDAGSLRGRPAAEIVAIAVPLADALAYAHGVGVIHRDLKVSNVLLEGGQPRLIDFGIAAVLAAGAAPRGGGSRYNVSPQQLSGEAAQGADDLYGFGVLLYELISGHPPLWPDPTPERILSERPAPVTSAHDLPPGLQALVAALLEKSPARRPPDMETVRRTLEEIRTQMASLGQPGAGAPAPHLVPPPEAPRAVTSVPSPPAGAAVVPPPLPAAKPAPETGGGSRMRVVLLAVLALAAAQLLLSLPAWIGTGDPGDGMSPLSVETPADVPVAPGAVSPADADPPAAAPAPAAAGFRASATQREEAAAALREAAELQARLEGMAVARWGGGEYAAASRALAEGRAALAARQFPAAVAALQSARRQLRDVVAQADRVVGKALAEGRSALARGDTAAAATAYRLVAKIAPGNEAAARGLRRSASFARVQELLANGARYEELGALTQAEAAYAAALDLDPDMMPARAGLDRVRARTRNDTFAGLVSQGLAALERGDFDAARAALDRARQVDPDAASVADLLARVEAAEATAAITAHRAAARQREETEAWGAARAEYDTVLAIDPTLLFAQEGKARADRRAEMARRLDDHLRNPQRLSADSVFAAATELLRRAQTVHPAGPRHRRQVTRLRQILDVMGQTIPVVLESDGRTEVTVYQVGRLGTFEQRTLELRPGVYTVVGQRRGYRDVRRQLVVKPGQRPAPLSVECEEEI